MIIDFFFSKLATVTLVFVFCFNLLACGRAYIPLELKTISREERQKGQEDFDIRLIPLTSDEASKANRTPYTRVVVEAGDLSKPAKFSSAESALKEVLPLSNRAGPYLIGEGDIISITRFLGRSDSPTSSVEIDKVVSSTGHVTILDNVKVKIAGLTISQFEDIYFDEAVRQGENKVNGIKIKDFNSKKIYVGGSVINPLTVRYTDKPIFLKDIISKANVKVGLGADMKIEVTRGEKIFTTSVNKTQEKLNPFFRMFPNDSVKFTPIIYKREHVLIVGETGAQSSVEIDALSRKSLSNALFDKSMMSHVTSDYSQIYIIRKSGKKYLAYHLDITNPVRINLANDFEMRPDDIIFVAAQPLTTYNRALAHILGVVGVTRTARNQIRSEIN